ncbi:Odorant receptor Or27a [Rhyzopertha dominica]|nr:Odorant receptor Or27a [Rhyzopertha dominica]
MYKHTYLRIDKKSLMALGLWPGKVTDHTVLQKIYEIYGTALRIYFVLFVISQLVQLIIVSTKDVQEAFDNMGVSLLYSVDIFKIRIAISKVAQGLSDQVMETEKKILEGGNERRKRLFDKYVKENSSLDRFILSVGVVTIIPFFVVPLVQLHTQPELYYPLNSSIPPESKPLPFSSWFPFDKEEHYTTAFIMHVIVGIYGCFSVVGTDMFFMSLVRFGKAQMKLLQYKFKHFKEVAIANAKPEEDEEEAIERYIKECILEHQYIIGYIHKLDNALRFLMLLDFAECSLQMAAIAFYVTASGFSLKILFAVEYLSAMLYQLYIFYYTANDVILESTAISTAIWTSKWYECTPKVKNLLRVIMLRAQRPLTLSVGPFYVMSTETAINILRTAASYVAFFRQVYARKQHF